MSQYLQRLKEHFSDNDQAMDAISFIENLLREHPLPSTKATIDFPTDFPLPIEDPQENDFFMFTDGACRGNPGPGSWGLMVQNHKGEVIFESSSVDSSTTNNIMEMTAVIEGLKLFKNFIEDEGLVRDEVNLRLYSDSKYVVDGISKWLPGWKARGWKKADKKAPENLKLWQELDELNMEFAKLQFFWVRGHSGHPQNERCDQLANMALDDSGF